MSLTILELDRVERRVLGALRCIDATTRAAIEQPLRVEVTLNKLSARLLRNSRGLYVISEAPGLAAHSAAFAQAPATPALGALALKATVSDPAGRYLPRLASLTMPRDPLSAHGLQATSLFQPIEIALYPSGTAPVGANWAILRITLGNSGNTLALGGALLRVSKGGSVLARGLTDWHGEALLPVSGVPVTTWSDAPGAVVVSEIDVVVEAVFDPTRGTRVNAAAVRNGQPPAMPPLVDPDWLESHMATLPRASQTITIAARRTQSLSLGLSLP